jgi:hypothetical protein
VSAPSRCRLTLLAGNLTFERFKERLQETTIADRLAGDGVFVAFAGESMRAELRAVTLGEGSGP